MMDGSMHDKPSGYRWPLRRLGRIRPPPDDKSPDTVANARVAGFAMLIAFALMALFNSGELRSFTRDLPGSWLADQMVVYSDQWHELMLALGPAHARPAMHELFDGLREMRW
jgi:hypothetical protein